MIPLVNRFLHRGRHLEGPLTDLAENLCPTQQQVVPLMAVTLRHMEQYPRAHFNPYNRRFGELNMDEEYCYIVGCIQCDPTPSNYKLIVLCCASNLLKDMMYLRIVDNVAMWGKFFECIFEELFCMSRIIFSLVFGEIQIENNREPGSHFADVSSRAFLTVVILFIVLSIFFLANINFCSPSKNIRCTYSIIYFQSI